MSADKCKHCQGTGWYEPKNMGGIMVEPCNRCDAHKKNQESQKESADKCPVCLSALRYDHHKNPAPSISYPCTMTVCHESRRLAISRAAEIERLKADLAKHAELWQAAQKRSDWFESQRDDLADQVAALLEGKGKWDDRRAAQLEDLSRLINLCRKINTSSGIIAALSSMEQLGDELSTADTAAIEPSFVEFLNQLCRDDRRNQSNQET